MNRFRIHKLVRILQGLIGIVLIFAFQKIILTNYIETSELMRGLVTILLVIVAFVMLWITKDEVVQLVLSFMSREEYINVREDYFRYNWSNFKDMPTSGNYCIYYIVYKGEKIVVKIKQKEIK